MKRTSSSGALLTSFVSLLLCCVMLLGTTFAWFTDTVTTTNNIIQSGSLDIEFDYSENLTDWTPIKSDTEVLNKDAIWEPGFTDVAYLKVNNVGDLAVKYQFGVNIVEEKKGVNVAGTEFRLSDYIKFGVIEMAETDSVFATRDEAVAAITNAKNLGAGLTDAGSLLATENKTYALVVYMPAETGNVANYKKGNNDENRPLIKLGISVYATQLTKEEDSFGKDYDEDAAFSIWDGIVPTEMPASLVVDGTTQTIYVKDASAFAYLSTLSDKWVDLYTDGNGREFINYENGAGTDYYYRNKWTIKLEADIDLDNKPIAPVKIAIGERTGATMFDGNRRTIRNINATTGLFAAESDAAYSNLVLENVKANGGALAASARHSISNVTVKNANISGTDYVGGIVGKAFASVTGCKVIDSSVIATGKEAGGLVGYAETSSTSEIAKNTVKNVTVCAGNRAAGLVAQPNVNVKVYNNTVDTVTVGAEDTSKYAPGAVVSNALDAANVYDNTVVNANVTSIVVTGNADAVVDAIANGKAVKLTQDINLGKIDLTGAIPNDVVIDANGHKITTADSYGIEVTPGKNVTISNADVVMTKAGDYITYAAGFKIANGDYAGSTLTLKDCTITMANTDWAYAVNMPASVKNLNLVIDNCTLEGAVAVQCWGDNNTITITNSKLICNYTTSALYTSYCVVLQDDGSNRAENNTLVIDNCEFVYSGTDNFNSTIYSVDDRSGNNTVTVTNCTYGDKIRAY